MKVILGAGDQRWDGWTATQQSELDLLAPATFAQFFGEARAEAFLCEHVWEHLTWRKESGPPASSTSSSNRADSCASPCRTDATPTPLTARSSP